MSTKIVAALDRIITGLTGERGGVSWSWGHLPPRVSHGWQTEKTLLLLFGTHFGTFGTHFGELTNRAELGVYSIGNHLTLPLKSRTLRLT